MECVTCRSERVSRFIDGFGNNRIFCRNCWVSFPESVDFNEARNMLHINFGAVREAF